jgi:hypothetical protein
VVDAGVRVDLGDASKPHQTAHKELEALHAVREMTWGGDSLAHHGGAYALSEHLGICRAHGLPLCRGLPPVSFFLPVACFACLSHALFVACAVVGVGSWHFSSLFCPLHF